MILTVIGAFQEENEAVAFVTLMSWLLPLLLLLVTAMDVLLALAYMKLHPWNGLLKDQVYGSIFSNITLIVFRRRMALKDEIVIRKYEDTNVMTTPEHIEYILQTFNCI